MSDVSLNIPIKPSSQHYYLLTAIYLLLALAFVVIRLHITVKICLLVALFTLGFWSYRNLRGRQQYTGLKVSNGEMQVLAQQKWHLTENFRASLLTSWLVIVQFHCRGKQERLILWPDSSDAESLRQFRVWLHCGAWRKNHKP